MTTPQVFTNARRVLKKRVKLLNSMALQLDIDTTAGAEVCSKEVDGAVKKLQATFAMLGKEPTSREAAKAAVGLTFGPRTKTNRLTKAIYRATKWKQVGLLRYGAGRKTTAKAVRLLRRRGSLKALSTAHRKKLRRKMGRHGEIAVNYEGVDHEICARDVTVVWEACRKPQAAETFHMIAAGSLAEAAVSRLLAIDYDAGRLFLAGLCSAAEQRASGEQHFLWDFGQDARALGIAPRDAHDALCLLNVYYGSPSTFEALLKVDRDFFEECPPAPYALLGLNPRLHRRGRGSKETIPFNRSWLLLDSHRRKHAVPLLVNLVYRWNNVVRALRSRDSSRAVEDVMKLGIRDRSLPFPAVGVVLTVEELWELARTRYGSPGPNHVATAYNELLGTLDDLVANGALHYIELDGSRIPSRRFALLPSQEWLDAAYWGVPTTVESVGTEFVTAADLLKFPAEDDPWSRKRIAEAAGAKPRTVQDWVGLDRPLSMDFRRKLERVYHEWKRSPNAQFRPDGRL